MFPFNLFHFPKLEKDLRQVRKLSLNQEAKKRLKSSLLSEFRRVTTAEDFRYNKAESKLIINFKPMIPALIIIILLGSGVGTAFAADSAKPGDLLFGVDQAVEKVKFSMSFSDLTKARLKAEIAEERGKEHEQLVKEHKVKESEEGEKLANLALEQAIATIIQVQERLAAKGKAQSLANLEEVELKLENLQLRFLAKQEEREGSEREEEGLTEAEVKIIGGKALVKIEFNDIKSSFILETTNEDDILQAIADKTGLTKEQVRPVLKMEIEEEREEDVDEDLNENENENENENKNENSNINENQDEDEEDEDLNENENRNTNRNSNINRNQNTNESDDDEDANNIGKDDLKDWEIEVKVKEGMAEIKTKHGENRSEWNLVAKTQAEILEDIKRKTGLTVNQIKSIWQYEVEVDD